MFFSGIREGEILALTLNDFDEIIVHTQSNSYDLSYDNKLIQCVVFLYNKRGGTKQKMLKQTPIMSSGHVWEK